MIIPLDILKIIADYHDGMVIHEQKQKILAEIKHMAMIASLKNVFHSVPTLYPPFYFIAIDLLNRT